MIAVPSALRAVRYLLLVSAGALSASTAVASAATSVAITVGPDPVESITTQLGAKGEAPNTQQEIVTVKYKAAGGAGCGANPDADDGTQVVGNGWLNAGAYEKSSNVTFDTAGNYLVCAWMTHHAGTGSGVSTYTVVATDSKVVAVRIPKLSIGLSVSPTTVAVGQTFQVTAVLQAEAERMFMAYALPDVGRGCAVNSSAAYQERTDSVFSGTWINGGPQTRTQNMSLGAPGPYLICAYFDRRGSGAAPPQASAVASVVVLPPCVVPVVVAGERLAAAKGRLAAASCGLGRVRYVASARYARGVVFKFAPAAGQKLANAAPVDVFVSSGRPCVVPRVPASRSLSVVKAKLVKAGCAVGPVTHRRSPGIRRGRVIRLSKPAGARLAPRTRIAIVVSRGRR